MKKILLFLCFTFSVCLLNAAQNSSIQEVPVVNGKVVFTDTISTLSGDEDIRRNLQQWFTEYSKTRTGRVILDDPSLKVMEFQFIDYLEMEKRALMIYSIYMKYNVRVIYGNNKCFVRVNRISYIEPDDMNDKDVYNPLIPAERILIERKYKVAMVKDALEKIEDHTLSAMESLFRSIKEKVK